ncbi:helix-turn-helix transcriptional regulator [Sphingomonas sp. Ag1]|uniref:helix-turn-helix transcriptional regulator n=1 Tax=Sphingomonas sp. Ag1 TaxID=1642949 RepID=UPI000B00F0A4|nr:AlpA family phage regulatory protein [Sphingomonas sp. Ag1]
MTRRPLMKVAEAKQDGRQSAFGRFLRINDVIASTGLSRATIYRLVANRDFPAQHQLTKRSIGWWESDVDAWLRSRLGQPHETA